MARRKCTFKESDVARALRAAKKAGVKVKIEIEIEPGRMTLIPMDEMNSKPGKHSNPWDVVYDVKNAKRPS